MWNPKAVQLNGPKITFDTLVLHDYAQITFDGNTFADTGTLPIIGFQLNGRPVATPGYLDPRGGVGAPTSTIRRRELRSRRPGDVPDARIHTFWL